MPSNANKPDHSSFQAPQHHAKSDAPTSKAPRRWKADLIEQLHFTLIPISIFLRRLRQLLTPESIYSRLVSIREHELENVLIPVHGLAVDAFFDVLSNVKSVSGFESNQVVVTVLTCREFEPVAQMQSLGKMTMVAHQRD